MDRKRGIKNVSVSITFKIMILIADVLVRRFLIQYIGNELNGLNYLYHSILSVLSVAELGVGIAITFCMYKPIVDGDNNKVSALYGLFKKLYLIIGFVIVMGGCAVMPLLPYLARGYQSVDVNLYFTFALMLVSVVIPYIYSAKSSLINAYKNNYITTTISSLGLLLQSALQIAVLILMRSFVLYLVCRIVSAAVQFVATEVIARRKYGDIIKKKQSIDSDTKKDVTQKIKAMFMHKIGGVLVNTADSIIISAFIGVAALGRYSNYTAIVIAMSGAISLCFTPLTSVIGHMCVSDDSTQINKYLNFFHTFNFVLGIVFFLGYYAVIDNLVTILFSNGLEFAKSVSFVITLNYFIQFMRQSVMLFRDATGTFYYDRWKSIWEGLLNIVLSIGFVFLFKHLWGDDFAVVGVIVATIITNIFICHIVEPHVFYKYVLNTNAKTYYVRNYIYIGIFTCALTALHYSMISNSNQWVEMFANAGISLIFSFVISTFVILLNKDFLHYAKNFVNRLMWRKSQKHNSVSLDCNGIVTDGKPNNNIIDSRNNEVK